MIKIGDLVIVNSKMEQIPEFMGIVLDRIEGCVWEWTVVEIRSGDYVPCSAEEIRVINTERQAESWEKKQTLKKILDKNKK